MGNRKKQSTGLTPSPNSRPDQKQTTPMTPLNQQKKEEEATPTHTPTPSPPTHINPQRTAAHSTWPHIPSGQSFFSPSYFANSSSRLCGRNLPSVSYVPLSLPCFALRSRFTQMRNKGSSRIVGRIAYDSPRWIASAAKRVSGTDQPELRKPR